MTPEELEREGLPFISINDRTQVKLRQTFEHFCKTDQQLPGVWTVKNTGEEPILEVNKSRLAVLAKCLQGKQVFKGITAAKLLDEARRDRGIAAPPNPGTSQPDTGELSAGESEDLKRLQDINDEQAKQIEDLRAEIAARCLVIMEKELLDD